MSQNTFLSELSEEIIHTIGIAFEMEQEACHKEQEHC
jgi:hypothetical protein